MNSPEIQKLLDNPDFNGAVNLPGGEFEGPFYINRPCTVTGNNTTLWSGGGCIVTVNSPNVTLKNMRIEITGVHLPPHKNIAVYSVKRDTAFENVEVSGNIAGIDGEEKFWGIPKALALGKFPANRNNKFTAILEIPVKTEIEAKFYDIEITPTTLNPGRNALEITTAPIRAGSYVYGEILLKSAVIRRVTLSGSADASIAEQSDAPMLFEPSFEAFKGNENIEASIIYPEITELAEAAQHSTLPLYAPDYEDKYIVGRGMRIILNSEELEIELVCTDLLSYADIDSYAFILGDDGAVSSNEQLVFFGRDCSPCKSVRYLNTDRRVMLVNTSTLPSNAAQIDFVFSIYGNDRRVDFSKLKNPAVSIKCGDGRVFILPIDGSRGVKTIIALELTRTESNWELIPLGMTYRFGMERLCGDYGVRTAD
ncbi:MAG: TerD family protein [Oscillospiraceae bacterium]|nr:TerD family protein [Oscillospiraceae bacterium]